MPTCPNCNKQLPDGTKFCEVCGTRLPQTTFCAMCGAALEAGAAFCQNCGAAVAVKPVAPIVEPVVAPVVEPVVAPVVEPVAEPVAAPVVEPVAAPVVEPVAAPVAEPAKKKKSPKLALLFGGIGLAVVAIIVVVLLLFKGGPASQQSIALYVKDDQLFFMNLQTGGTPWQVTDALANDMSSAETALNRGLCITKDGSRIFFADKYESGDSGINLYYRPTNNPTAEVVKVDSDIRNFYVSDDGNVVTYAKGSEGDLYQYQASTDEKEKIAAGVGAYNFSVSADGKKIGYEIWDSQYQSCDVYLKYMGKDKEKMASGVSEICNMNEDMTVLYYLKDGALYKQEEGKEKEKIASDVNKVLKIYDSGEVYFTTKETQNLAFTDYVIDDKAAEDALITEYPTSPSVPYSWMYNTWDEYYAAYEAYQLEYAAYQEAYTAYWAKMDRDYLRDALKEEYIEYTRYILYFFDGKDVTKLVENFVDSEYSYDNTYAFAENAPVMVYQAHFHPNFQKLYISGITSTYEVREQINADLETEKIYYVANRTERNNVNAEKVSQFDMNKNGTKIYFYSDVSNDEGTLYGVTVSDGKVGNAEKYDTGVYIYRSDFVDEETYIYMKNYKDDAGDLYINKKKVANDVNRVYAATGDKVLYFTDVNTNKENGTLYLYNGEESKKIDDDVYYYSCSLSKDLNKILYYTDYSNGCGTLKIWENGESKKIADDVYGHTGNLLLDWNKIFIITDRDGDEATLSVYENGVKTKIADEIYTNNLDITADGQLLYLVDYSTSSNEGDLYQWTGSQSVKLDEDVQYLIPYNTENLYRTAQ